MVLYFDGRYHGFECTAFSANGLAAAKKTKVDIVIDFLDNKPKKNDNCECKDDNCFGYSFTQIVYDPKTELPVTIISGVAQPIFEGESLYVAAKSCDGKIFTYVLEAVKTKCDKVVALKGHYDFHDDNADVVGVSTIYVKRAKDE